MTVKDKARKEELLLHYLYNKANGGSNSDGIPECNLYGDKEPWEIWEECKGSTQLMDNDNDLFIFTKVKKKTTRGSHLDRTVGTGAWKGKDIAVSISGNKNNDDGTLMRLSGKKKRFCYESKTVHDHRWLMIEYSLDASTMIQATFQNYALCQLKRMDKSKKQLKLGEQEDPRIKVIDNENTEAKRQKILLITEEDKQPELTCNNDNGPGATTINTKEVAIVDFELPCGDGQEIIFLSNNDNDPTTYDKKNDDDPNTKDAQANDIEATQVERQLTSLESPSGELICKESPKVSDGGSLSSKPNDVAGDNGDWSESFAKELTKGQVQPMQEPEIEMLPNLFYFELSGCKLLPK